MILDEPMEIKLATPAKFSVSGDFAKGTHLVFSPPRPDMSRETYKMIQWITKIQKQGMLLLASATNPDVDKLRENPPPKLEAGVEVKALHEKYDDGKEENREEILKQIEEEFESVSNILGMCDDIDLFRMTTDFGRMIANSKTGKIKGEREDGAEVATALTLTLWDQSVGIHDRVEAVLRYCCFFDLTSCLGK